MVYVLGCTTHVNGKGAFIINLNCVPILETNLVTILFSIKKHTLKLYLTVWGYAMLHEKILVSLVIKFKFLSCRTYSTLFDNLSTIFKCPIKREKTDIDTNLFPGIYRYRYFFFSLWWWHTQWILSLVEGSGYYHHPENFRVGETWLVKHLTTELWKCAV